jgi:hypothetical protein
MGDQHWNGKDNDENAKRVSAGKESVEILQVNFHFSEVPLPKILA